jgi:hypothetical protein
MKKIVFFSLCLLWASAVEAQTLPVPFTDWVKQYHHWKLNTSTNKFSLVFVNAYYVRTYYMVDNNGIGTEYWRDWTVWISGTRNIVGMYEMINSIDSDEQSFPLRFIDEFGNEIIESEVYNKKVVREEYHAKLSTSKHLPFPKEDAMFYAELPKELADVNLYIVSESEMRANKGVPKQKVKFGELKFNSKTNKFTFLSR